MSNNFVIKIYYQIINIPGEDEHEISTWSHWSTCSVTCGQGQQTRNRACVEASCDDWQSSECNGVQLWDQRVCVKPCCHGEFDRVANNYTKTSPWAHADLIFTHMRSTCGKHDVLGSLGSKGVCKAVLTWWVSVSNVLITNLHTVSASPHADIVWVNFRSTWGHDDVFDQVGQLCAVCFFNKREAVKV